MAEPTIDECQQIVQQNLHLGTALFEYVRSGRFLSGTAQDCPQGCEPLTNLATGVDYFLWPGMGLRWLLGYRTQLVSRYMRPFKDYRSYIMNVTGFGNPSGAKYLPGAKGIKQLRLVKDYIKSALFGGVLKGHLLYSSLEALEAEEPLYNRAYAALMSGGLPVCWENYPQGLLTVFYYPTGKRPRPVRPLTSSEAYLDSLFGTTMCSLLASCRPSL